MAYNFCDATDKFSLLSMATLLPLRYSLAVSFAFNLSRTDV
jgi:hypothetical protein